jgi:hypothetical protein
MTIPSIPSSSPLRDLAGFDLMRFNRASDRTKVATPFDYDGILYSVYAMPLLPGDPMEQFENLSRCNDSVLRVADPVANAWLWGQRGIAAYEMILRLDCASRVVFVPAVGVTSRMADRDTPLSEQFAILLDELACAVVVQRPTPSVLAVTRTTSRSSATRGEAIRPSWRLLPRRTYWKRALRMVLS